MRLHRGTVTGLDAERGIGSVTDTAGTGAGGAPAAVYRFHVTEIAGGSRTIAVGTEVVFALRARPLGEVEAVVTPAPAGRSGDA